MPVRALFSTGAAMDVALLGAVPVSASGSSRLPRGAGTVLAGLSHGLPMVITPISADQPDNARRVEVAGAGTMLLRPDAASLRAVIGRALVDPEMRAAAAGIAREMSAMPSSH